MPFIEAVGDGDLAAAHLRLRTLVSKGFTPRRIRELEPRVTELAVQHLDTMMEMRVQGTALAQAKAQMRGDKTEVAMQKILGAEGGSMLPGCVDDKKLQDVLRDLKDPAERRAVLEAYKKRTGLDLSDTTHTSVQPHPDVPGGWVSWGAFRGGSSPGPIFAGAG